MWCTRWRPSKPRSCKPCQAVASHAALAHAGGAAAAGAVCCPVGQLLRTHRVFQPVPAALAQKPGPAPGHHRGADVAAIPHAPVCALWLGHVERPYRPACALAALVFDAGAGDFSGPVGARRHLVDCGRAAAHVHPHQRHDADERGCHGPLGEPGRQLRCAPLRPGAAVGLAGLSGHGVCGRGVV